MEERIERKQWELARLVEVAEAGLVPDQALPHLETTVRFNQGQDISQIEERRPLGEFHNEEGKGLQRLLNSGQTEEPGNGQTRTSTPADGEDRASQVRVESFLRLSGQEEEELEERRRLREQDGKDDENRIHSSLEAPQGGELEAANDPPGGAAMAAGTFKATRSVGTSLDTF